MRMVTLFFPKDGMASVIGATLLQLNPDTSGDGLQRIMDGSVLRKGHVAVSDLVIVRTVVIDQKWNGTLYP